jgi:NADPH:quinone reductase-like Zn-dependent oxidoreductase
VNTAGLPGAIRAYAISRPGTPPGWREVPCPRPGPDEVLVRVAVVALNPVDVAIAAGRLHDAFRYEYPVTLGRALGAVEVVGYDAAEAAAAVTARFPGGIDGLVYLARGRARVKLIVTIG